jgi:hypothetical protein
MTERNFKTSVGLGAIVFMAMACSGTANTTGSASGGVGGNSTTGGASAETATGGTANSVSSGGSSTAGSATGGEGYGGAPTGGVASVGGAETGGTASGGTSSGTGGKATGGAATGGKAAGGTGTGGKATGGASTGAATGGKSTGGASTGAATGGKSTGGASTGATTGGKSTGGASTGGTSSGTIKIVLPAANALWDYQIGGAYTPPSGVQVVSRDRNSAPASGLYNICYVNGFQIQPDEENFWTSQHPTLILRDSSGNPIVDADWGEMLLDTSTAAKRTELATIVGAWITQCKTDGFNAVEIDNLDSYSRSTGLLTQANNIAFMALLSSTAHQNGLAIAQKNSSELLGSVATMGTDFAVVEECNRYSECDTFKSAYGNLVFIVEYRLQDFQTGCSKYPELSIVLRDVNVSTPGSSSYVYQGC